MEGGNIKLYKKSNNYYILKDGVVCGKPTPFSNSTVIDIYDDEKCDGNKVDKKSTIFDSDTVGDINTFVSQTLTNIKLRSGLKNYKFTDENIENIKYVGAGGFSCVFELLADVTVDGEKTSITENIIMKIVTNNKAIFDTERYKLYVGLYDGDLLDINIGFVKITKYVYDETPNIVIIDGKSNSTKLTNPNYKKDLLIIFTIQAKSEFSTVYRLGENKQTQILNTYYKNMMSAYKYLYSRNITYCDFKSDNIMFFGDNHDKIKIIDYGGIEYITCQSGCDFTVTPLMLIRYIFRNTNKTVDNIVEYVKKATWVDVMQFIQKAKMVTNVGMITNDEKKEEKYIIGRNDLVANPLYFLHCIFDTFCRTVVKIIINKDQSFDINQIIAGVILCIPLKQDGDDSFYDTAKKIIGKIFPSSIGFFNLIDGDTFKWFVNCANALYYLYSPDQNNRYNQMHLCSKIILNVTLSSKKYYLQCILLPLQPMFVNANKVENLELYLYSDLEIANIEGMSDKSNDDYVNYVNLFMKLRHYIRSGKGDDGPKKIKNSKLKKISESMDEIVEKLGLKNHFDSLLKKL